MTHVTRRLTANNRDQLRNLRSAVEYGLPVPFLSCSPMFSAVRGSESAAECSPCTAWSRGPRSREPVDK